MALPNGFLDELKSRLSLAQVVGRKLSWDPRKSNPGKGDYWAPCPFHQEKTASFHVDDAKGFYYCFGCHVKGDAVNFVREIENVGFMEAVEILAGEAGMTMPAPDPRARAQAKKQATLHDVMELATSYYRMQLRSAAASSARDYIAGRGLDAAALERFEVGFAPAGRTGLFEHLKGKGVDPAQMDEAGLVILPDSGTPFDRFRDRIMFPIRDARGKPIAFGGRAMSPEARAKYLNSPETPLFDKGRALYNIGPGREAAGKAGSLIVAEGYMDVIALCLAGFDHAVAPLGTAITESQIQMIWRMADEPIIALDGDKAGLRAGLRLADLALPLLTPGKSLRFALLPEGLDPDDLLKRSGPEAMRKLLAEAVPMAALIWRRETEEKVFDSPERRAALDARLKSLLAEIKDPSIRDHYRAEFSARRRELFAPPPRGGSGPTRQMGKMMRPPAKAPRPLTGTKSSIRASADSPEAQARIRERAILQLCIAHPALADRFEAELERLPIAAADLAQIRDALIFALPFVLENAPAENQQERLMAELATRIPQAGLDAVMRGYLPRHGDAREVERDLAAQISRHMALIGRMRETSEAEQDILGPDDEGLTWRQREALRAQEEAARIDHGNQQDEGAEDARNSAFLTQMVEEARRNSKKSD